MLFWSSLVLYRLNFREPGVHSDGGAPGPISKNINLKPQTPGVHPDGGGQELGGEQGGVQVSNNHQ